VLCCAVACTPPSRHPVASASRTAACLWACGTRVWHPPAGLARHIHARDCFKTHSSYSTHTRMPPNAPYTRHLRPARSICAGLANLHARVLQDVPDSQGGGHRGRGLARRQVDRVRVDGLHDQDVQGHVCLMVSSKSSDETDGKYCASTVHPLYTKGRRVQLRPRRWDHQDLIRERYVRSHHGHVSLMVVVAVHTAPRESRARAHFSRGGWRRV
jgi:hypothetical protein